MSVYNYQPYDNIFDIESMENLYVDTHYFPDQHYVVVDYLSNVDGYHDFDQIDPKTHQKISLTIAERILRCNQSLKNLVHDKKNPLGIRFKNLRIPKNLIEYCHFWGLTPTRNTALNYVNSKGQIHSVTDKAVAFAKQKHSSPKAKWISPTKYDRKLLKGQDYTSNTTMSVATPYYTVKRTDPQYDAKKYGITMGFNSTNYDLTMIATFLGHVVHNNYARKYLNQACNANSRLSLKTWTVPNDPQLQNDRQELLDKILKPEFLRHYNNLLFTNYKRSMPELLQHQDDLQSQDKAHSKSFFKQIDNPAWYIYKGWTTSNRYLDVANLNEHMKFVPLKRIAAMEGWQILESKNVTANTTVIKGLNQIADLIGYNNSDVQVTKKTFELAQYQDSLTLRRILLKKFPQLTYTFNLRSALERYLKKAENKIKPQSGNLITRINTKDKLSGLKEALNDKKNSYKLYNFYQQARSAADPQDADVRPDALRFSPLMDDASSAKLISNVIAPYHSMKDWPDIEYTFPDPRALKIFKKKHPEQKLLHDKPFNLLEDTLNWTKAVDKKYGLTKYPPANEAHVLDKHHSLYKTFLPIYHLYKTVEGHNINDTLDKYAGQKQLYNINGKLETVGPSIDMTKLLHQTNGNIPYLHQDGSSTGTTAVFSYGGIHGVEFKLSKYKNDYRKYLKMCKVQKQLKVHFKPHAAQTSLFGSVNPSEQKASPADVARAGEATVTVDGQKEHVLTKSYVKGSGKHAEWKNLEPPELYKHPSGSGYKLNDKYAYVSVDPVSHEDFSGYYPMLISRLGIMWPHDEAKDTYHQIYVERLHLKHMLKKYTKNSHDWNVINTKQLLRKLLLNSASGAGDAKFFNSIRMNNKIVSMRIMGQLFTWRMAQSVCLADKNNQAKVTSSNTDGVYLAGLPNKINDVALQKAVRPFSLFIGPVPLSRFVSKDANNRAEINNYGTKDNPKNVLTEAKGATLNAWQGPSVTATVSHPAIIDYALAHYLAYQPDPCNSQLDRHQMMKLINNKKNELSSSDPKVRLDGMVFFQWVIASNPSKHRYPFIEAEKYDPTKQKWIFTDHAIAIPHTNRIFLMKHPTQSETNHALYLATREKVNAATFKKLASHGEKPKNDPSTVTIFKNWGDKSLPSHKEDGYDANCYQGSIAKLPSMPEDQNVLIENHALNELSKNRCQEIERGLDYQAYLDLIATKYHASWDNNA